MTISPTLHTCCSLEAASDPKTLRLNQESLVSIIINNYNYGRFLRDAIDSALGQTYRNLEVIVVDDGSTDNSVEIIASYQDRIIPILKKNGGQASALNAGFARSQGDIIIFLDSDDMLLANTVGRVVQSFAANIDLAKLMYRMEVIDATGRPMGILKPHNHLPRRSGDLRRHVLTFPFDMIWMATSGNAFSARVLRHIFPVPEPSFRILADFYLAHVTPLFGAVVFLDYVGAYYRVHGSNNYHIASPTLDLDYIRNTITHSIQTTMYIRKFADQLGFYGKTRGMNNILSVSTLSKRMVSLKLDRSGHPIQDDTILKLFLLGIKASFQRFDVSWTMRILYVLWFVAMLFAPKPLVRWLVVKLSFPEERMQLNKMLKGFHRR
jgi:glycosyltransferase involved in cell wall biosynthesis